MEQIRNIQISRVTEVAEPVLEDKRCGSHSGTHFLRRKEPWASGLHLLASWAEVMETKGP